MLPRVVVLCCASLAFSGYGWCQGDFAKAVELHRAGNFSAAAQEYQAVLRAEPGRVDARSNLGAVYAKLGRYQDAIEQYQQALESAPAEYSMPLRLNLGIAYYKASRIREASDEFEKVHSGQPGNLNATLLLADCDLQLGRNGRVIELLTPLDAEHPEDRTATYLLGMALIREGRIPEGQKRVDRLLRDGESAEGRFLLGSGMLTARDYPGAVREFGKAVALNPNLPSLQSYYGQALLATGDADGAEKAFRAELQSNPNEWEANQRLGEILVHRKRVDEAKPFLEHAALLRPGAKLVSPGASIAGGVGGLAVGAVAPDFPGLDLKARLGRGPVVLVFGSYTCPRFRGDSDSLNRLSAKYHGRVAFELVYIREAHAGQQWQSTMNQRDGVDLPDARNLGQKKEHAALCVRKLKIPYALVVDGMDRKVEEAYEGWPSRVYLVGRDGKVRFNSPLGELDFQADALDGAIAAALAAK